jgi:hypothetical protein
MKLDVEIRFRESVTTYDRFESKITTVVRIQNNL